MAMNDLTGEEWYSIWSSRVDALKAELDKALYDLGEWRGLAIHRQGKIEEVEKKLASVDDYVYYCFGAIESSGSCVPLDEWFEQREKERRGDE